MNTNNNNENGDLGNFFQSKKKKGTKKKQQQQQVEQPKEEKPQEEVKQEPKTEQKKETPAAKKVNSDEAAFMKQTDAYESSDEERAEINIDADSVIKDTKDVEKEKRLAEEKESGSKMGWDVIASKSNANATNTNSRAEFGTAKKTETAQPSSSGPIQFKRGSGPPTFKKSNAFGNKMEFPTFEGGKGGKNNQPLDKSDQQNVARSEQSTTGHFGMLAASARQQEAPREERKVQSSMPVFKGKAKIGGGAPQTTAANIDETKAHNYDTGFMTRNVKPNVERRDDGDKRNFKKDNQSSDEEDNRRNYNDDGDDFNTVTEKKREFKKGDGYQKQKKQFNDYQNKDGQKSNNFARGGNTQETKEEPSTFTSAPAVKKTASKPAQLPDKADWSNVFGNQ